MHLPRRTTATAAALALALTGSLAACSDDAPDSEIVEPAGAEPGVDDTEAPDAPAIDVEPTPP